VRQGEEKQNVVEALPSICTELDAVSKNLLQSANRTMLLNVRARLITTVH
jgi:hypothetical protein